MFLLYSLPLYFFLSFVGASDVKQPLQVLQTAVVAYISSPLRTFRGAIIIDDASASGTHRELSELLVKCPRDNAYKWGSMVDFLVQLGVSKPKYDSHVILSVKTSFRQILEKCQIGFDGEFQKARSWDVPLQKVSDVFNAHAPPRTSMKLNTHDAQYNFLVFLLMHWKLAFGNPPNNNVNTLQVVGQSPATTRNEAELVMPTGEAGANDFFVTTLNSEALKVNAVKEKVASASKPSLVFSIPVLNPNTINANQGPFSSSYASQPNAHIWQERGQQHQTVSNHPLVNHNKSTSRLSGKLPQAIVYPDELAQSTGFDGHRKLKRVTYSTKDESSNKKPRVDKFVSTPSVAPAIENINSYSSVSGNTSVSAYVQPLDVLKEAVELYSLSPLRTLQGSAIIDIPSASNTHNALSMLLVKFPRGNSIETGCFDDFLVELGFPRPPYVNAIILSVKASFLDILQKCRIEVDVDYKNASSWDIPLIVVGDVFKAYAPLWTTTKLKTQDDHYNFLIFLLMHWKLKYGVLPDFNCLSSSHEETLTEYNQMTFIANLPMVKTVNTPSSSKNTNFLIGGYSPEMLLLQQSHTNQVNPTTNNNYMATSRIAQPISISKEQYYNPYFPVRTDNPMSSVLNGYGGSTLNGNLVLPNAQQFQYSTNNVPTTTSIYHTGTLVRNILEPKKPQSDNQREKLEEPARIDNLSSSSDKHPLPSKETREAAKSVIKDAILEYVRDPIRTINNRLTINTPFSSDTHKELSEILSKYRSGTSYRKGNAERVICDIGKHVNFSEPLSNVRSDLVSILKKCEPGEYGYLKNWGDVIDEVRKVYQEHVPPGVKEGLLNEDEDAYSFLVFLLMHFKLKFKEISDNTRSPNQGLKRKLASTNTRQKKRRTGIDSAVAEVSCEKLGNAPYIPGTQYIDTDASKFKLCNREPFSGLLPGISNIVVIESTLNDKSPKPIVGSDPSLVKLSEHHRHLTPIIVGQNISPRTNIPTVKAIPELTYSVHSNAATENQSQKTQVGGDPNLQHELEPLITAATNDDVKKVSPTVQSFESDWISLTPKLFCNEVIVPETLDPTQVAQGLEPFSTEPAADTECIFQVFDTFNTEAEEGIEKIALSLDFSNGVASDDFFSYLN